MTLEEFNRLISATGPIVSRTFDGDLSFSDLSCVISEALNQRSYSALDLADLDGATGVAIVQARPDRLILLVNEKPLCLVPHWDSANEAWAFTQCPSWFYFLPGLVESPGFIASCLGSPEVEAEFARLLLEKKAREASTKANRMAEEEVIRRAQWEELNKEFGSGA